MVCRKSDERDGSVYWNGSTEKAELLIWKKINLFGFICMVKNEYFEFSIENQYQQTILLSKIFLKRKKYSQRYGLPGECLFTDQAEHPDISSFTKGTLILQTRQFF
jgi:hypothetical protein